MGTDTGGPNGMWSVKTKNQLKNNNPYREQRSETAGATGSKKGETSRGGSKAHSLFDANLKSKKIEGGG